MKAFLITLSFFLVNMSQVEALTFTVSNTNDSGIGSFRQAIIDANNLAGQDTVSFAIPGAGPHTIQPLTNLPTITDALIIDGYSQSGSSENTQLLGDDAVIQIIIDGSQNTSSPSNGFTVDTNGSSIGGFSVVGFADNGILLQTGATLIHGNFIGIMPDGNTIFFNNVGINIAAASEFNNIGNAIIVNRNLISGNISEGLLIASDSNNVLGNIIGLDATGSIAKSNLTGIKINSADNNIIGGQPTEERNTISGNGRGGIEIDGTFTSDNTQIINNIIGLDVSASQAIGNGFNAGINFIDVSNSQIQRNVIGGNLSGIFLQGLTRGVTLENNTIGGSALTGNQQFGIGISAGAGPNNIGNPITQVGNIISFNGNGGISVDRTDTQENRIMFNQIFSNTGLGIDLIDAGVGGVTSNDVGDTDFGGNTLLNFPDLSSAQINSGQISITGSYDGLSNQDFIFEVFANQQCDVTGNGEGELILGYINATTDSNGHANFSQGFPQPPAEFNQITALATDTLGNTSEFSACVVTGAVPPPPVATPQPIPTVSGSVLLLLMLLLLLNTNRLLLAGDRHD